MPTDYKKALALLAAEKNKNKTLNVMGKLRGFMEYDRINEDAITQKNVSKTTKSSPLHLKQTNCKQEVVAWTVVYFVIAVPTRKPYSRL